MHNNNEKMIKSLKGIINLLPDNLSEASKTKKQELLQRLQVLEEKNNKIQKNDIENQQVKQEELSIKD